MHFILWVSIRIKARCVNLNYGRELPVVVWHSGNVIQFSHQSILDVTNKWWKLELFLKFYVIVCCYYIAISIIRFGFILIELHLMKRNSLEKTDGLIGRSIGSSEVVCVWIDFFLFPGCLPEAIYSVNSVILNLNPRTLSFIINFWSFKCLRWCISFNWLGWVALWEKIRDTSNIWK